MTQEFTFSSIPCNLCGGREVTIAGRRSRSAAPLRTVACTACGLLWSDPRPHDPRKYYQDDYRLAYKKTHAPKAKHVLRAGRVALERLRKIAPLLQGCQCVLDVGSGGGEFAYLLHTRGHRVTGIEPNRGYGEYAAREYGLEILHGFAGEVPLAPQAFDLITVWHVLEHTEDPAQVLRRLRAALRPGGHLVVEVPNAEATCQSPRNTFHEAHLYTFNAASLEALAVRCGFQAAGMVLSADGGNITATFQATADLPPADRQRTLLAGNHGRITRILAAHTPWSHLLSPHPWRRAARRLGRGLEEWVATRRRRPGRALLDALYAQDAAVPAAGRTQWGWLAGAYVLALLLEEVLVDRVLPALQWSEAQAVTAFVALQIPVVALLLWSFRKGGLPGPQLARLAGLALPLLAVPAVC